MLVDKVFLLEVNEVKGILGGNCGNSKSLNFFVIIELY